MRCKVILSYNVASNATMVLRSYAHQFFLFVSQTETIVWYRRRTIINGGSIGTTCQRNHKLVYSQQRTRVFRMVGREENNSSWTGGALPGGAPSSSLSTHAPTTTTTTGRAGVRGYEMSEWQHRDENRSSRFTDDRRRGVINYT